MKLIADIPRGVLIGLGRDIPISCDVRTLANERRGRAEVVRTMPGNVPYEPATFPRGTWHVLRPRERDDPYKAPYYIPTDARQMVAEWSVVNGPDGKVRYDKPTGRQVEDREYGLHYSSSGTTLGCIKILRVGDLLRLVEAINMALDKDPSETVELEVV